FHLLRDFRNRCFGTRMSPQFFEGLVRPGSTVPMLSPLLYDCSSLPVTYTPVKKATCHQISRATNECETDSNNYAEVVNHGILLGRLVTFSRETSYGLGPPSELITRQAVHSA